MLSYLLLAAAAASLVQAADLTVSYPPPRTEEKYGSTCFYRSDNSSAPFRTAFPLSGTAPLSFTYEGASTPLAVAINWGENPRAFLSGNGSTVSWTNLDGSEGRQLVDTLLRTTLEQNGTFCNNLDTASVQSARGDLTLKGSGGTPANGTVATLLVQYEGVDGVKQSCSDIVLVRDYSPPSDVQCKDETTSGDGSNGAARGGMGVGLGAAAAVLAGVAVGGLW
ncbi:hypothetical protein JCM6882_001337 [Rhodosporidiobolus microsporus]